MSYIRAMWVFLVTYILQRSMFNITSHFDLFIFYGVAVLMALVSYITGRIEEIKEG